MEINNIQRTGRIIRAIRELTDMIPSITGSESETILSLGKNEFLTVSYDKKLGVDLIANKCSAYLTILERLCFMMENGNEFDQWLESQTTRK